MLNTALLEELRELSVSNESSLLEDLIVSYAQDLPGLLAKIREAIQKNDLYHAEFAAHSLKSSSGGLGADDAHAACMVIEEMAHERNLEACVAGLDRMELETANAVHELNAYLRAHKASHAASNSNTYSEVSFAA